MFLQLFYLSPENVIQIKITCKLGCDGIADCLFSAAAGRLSEKIGHYKKYRNYNNIFS